MKKIKGKVVVLEGVDGSGKTTQINFLKKKLDPVKNVFFPRPGYAKSVQKIKIVCFG